jgi:hypothetical protein
VCVCVCLFLYVFVCLVSVSKLARLVVSCSSSSVWIVWCSCWESSERVSVVWVLVDSSIVSYLGRRALVASTCAAYTAALWTWWCSFQFIRSCCRSKFHELRALVVCTEGTSKFLFLFICSCSARLASREDFLGSNLVEYSSYLQLGLYLQHKYSRKVFCIWWASKECVIGSSITSEISCCKKEAEEEE